MKKKVLILTTISGFLPQFLKGHVRILKELGAEIWYASNFDCPAYDFEPDYFEKEGIRTVSIPIERSPYRLRENAAALKTLTALIEREEIDLVHCHNPVGGILGRLAGARAKRKVQVMYTAHGLHFYKGAPWKNWLLYYPAEWLMARFTDHLVTINREDRERAARLPVKPGGAVHLIPGVGVDEERYQLRKELREEVRSELGIGKWEICLMTSALLHPDKLPDRLESIGRAWESALPVCDLRGRTLPVQALADDGGAGASGEGDLLRVSEGHGSSAEWR